MRADDSEVDYTAVIRGTLDPGDIYPFTSTNDYVTAQAEMDAATANALGGGGSADFYLIARVWTYQPVYRVRWMLDAELSGPSLRSDGTGAHESTVRMILRRYPLGDKTQIVTDPADDERAEMPYRDALSGVQPALLLRTLWGTGPRTLTLSGRGTATFTPATLEFTLPGQYEPSIVAYDTATIAAYPFIEAQQDSRQPALWLARTGDPEGEGWKISYCAHPETGDVESRWDDPDEAVPEYAPLEVQPPWHW